MIYEQTCSCGTVIRANGEYKFKDSAKAHFRRAHAEEWNHLQIVEDDAQAEFRMLREKCPELFFSYSAFEIDIKKLLSKNRT